jgi:hypothetical protein
MLRRALCLLPLTLSQHSVNSFAINRGFFASFIVKNERHKAEETASWLLSQKQRYSI